MRRILIHGLLFFALTTLCFSCKKSSSSASYYVKFTKNGTAYTFTNAVAEVGADLGDPTKQDFTINTTSSDSKEELTFSVQITGSTFPTGMYSSNNYPTSFVDFEDIVLTGSTQTFYNITDAPGLDPSLYTFNITSITSTEVKGTFSGNYLFDETGSDPNPDQITQGSFDVKRVP